MKFQFFHERLVVQVVNSLIETGYQRLKRSVAFARQEEEALGDAATPSDLSGANDAHMALVLFCDNFLRQTEDGTNWDVLIHACCWIRVVRRRRNIVQQTWSLKT